MLLNTLWLSPSFTPDSIKKLDEKLQLAAQYPNLETEISLIYGLPLQTVQSFEQSVSWVQRKLPSATIKAFPLMLLRGTALQRDAHRFGTCTPACYDTAPLVTVSFYDTAP